MSNKSKINSHKVKNVQKTLYSSTLNDYESFLEVDEEIEKYYDSSEEKYKTRKKFRD